MSTTYPSVYKAQAVTLRPGSIDAYVPQVFGDTLVTVIDAIGAFPDAPGMGWVFFQGGDAEFPVWSGVGVSSGGEGGGGGTDEVWVGPDDPGGTIELWYDTDEPSALTSASAVSFTPTGTIAATDVQTALAEVASEAAAAVVTPTAWVTVPSFTGSWVVVGGVWQVPRYRKVGDITYVQGVIKNGTLGSVAFVLPTGFRPPKSLELPATNNNNAAGTGLSSFQSLQVDASGNVMVGSGLNTFVSFNFQFSTT